MSGSATATIIEGMVFDDARPKRSSVKAELDQLLPSFERLLSIKPDIDVSLPIRTILHFANSHADQAEKSFASLQRNVAQQEHAAAAFIALKIIPQHRDYSSLQSNHLDSSRIYNNLLLRIHEQQERFNGAPTMILANDAWVGVPGILQEKFQLGAIEQVLEKDYDLPDQIGSLPKRERELLSQRTWGTFRCEHPSCWDEIDKFRFNVFEDLAHHYKVAHPAIILPENFLCNYSACKRSEDPFTRKDAYRDHLREYHMEDMLKRHKNQKREQEWLASRVISPDWWRCSRCLARRIDVKKEGWTCRDCGRECERIRVTIRTTAIRPIYTTPEGENINALNLLPSQKKKTPEDQTALQEGQPSTGNALTESLEAIKASKTDTETSTGSKTSVINAVSGFAFIDFGYSHSEYQNHKVVPFTTIKQLGHGSLGSVDAVRRSGEGEGPLFARKVIRLPNMARKRLLPLIQQEVTVLRELRHRHIVQVVSTYETTSVPRQFGIILHPAGDEDLSHYLDRIGEDDFPEVEVKRLWKWQYCLASAVAYIHAQNIRHKDIKPSNAICKGDEIFLTDFGSAHQFSAGLTSSTEGYAVGITKMYSAPEVISLDRRGRPADIYSLGCVFAEMVTVAGHRRIEDFHDFRSEPIPDEPDRMTLCYYATAHKLEDWFSTDESPWAYSLLSRMLVDDQKLRPSAEEVLSILAERTPCSDCSCRPRTAYNPNDQEIQANGGSEANGKEAQTEEDMVLTEEERLLQNIDQGLLQWTELSLETIPMASRQFEDQMNRATEHLALFWKGLMEQCEKVLRAAKLFQTQRSLISVPLAKHHFLDVCYSFIGSYVALAMLKEATSEGPGQSSISLDDAILIVTFHQPIVGDTLQLLKGSPWSRDITLKAPGG